jgi:heat shock protein HslJ
MRSHDSDVEIGGLVPGNRIRAARVILGVMLPKPLTVGACGLVAALFVVGCSSGKQSATPTTKRASAAGLPTTVRLPARLVKLGSCPKVFPGETRVPFNEGVRGLAKEFVPLTATTVRVCRYQELPTGTASVTSGTPALAAAALEAETNELQRYPVGTEIAGGCVAFPRDLFVTFANRTQRASVAYTTGCAAPPSNRVLLAHATDKWLKDLENFTDHSLTADDLFGEWKPVSIAGYHGPLTSPPLAPAPQLNFDGTSKWTGSDGCNYTGGSYRLGLRNTVHFTEVSTKRGCLQTTPPDPVQRAARIELHGFRLKFFGPAGHELAEYELFDLLAPKR